MAQTLQGAVHSTKPSSLSSPTDKSPNGKVEHFLNWVKDVSKAVWDLGRNISANEQTIGFKGTIETSRGLATRKKATVFWPMQ